jgi:hypothetical protein
LAGGEEVPVSATSFLSNETLWQTLATLVKTARHIDAAIAYFGQGGAKLLPLRRGHRLIVDMSPATVRTGGTDPREIEKLMRRGVQAFTRRNLHAKLIVADRSVLAGSSNVSKHSQQVLDEAAILTNEPAALRRAREFVDRLCTEPVRPEYLAECKRLYRPPRFNGQRANGTEREQRAKHAKLWMVNLRDYAFLPESESERYEQGEDQAASLMREEVRSEMDSFHWSSKPKMANELEFGDWVIQAVTRRDKTTAVYPPGQLLLVDNYVRNAESGKKRYVFHLEVPKHGETMTWAAFCRAARSLMRSDNLATPRTRPIRDVQVADGLLGLWTPGGRIARRRRRAT